MFTMFKMPITTVTNKDQAGHLSVLMFPNYKKWRRFSHLVSKDRSELTYKQQSELKGLDRFFELIIPAYNTLVEVANTI